MKTITKYQDGGATLIVDHRYFPLQIALYNGITMPLAEAFIRAQREHDATALAEGTKIISVSDTTHLGMPSPPIRKRLAEYAVELDRSAAMHGYVTVVPNALMRGLITAIVWLMGGQTRPNTNVATLPNALRIAIAQYESMGIKIPLNPDTYEVPQNLSARAA